MFKFVFEMGAKAKGACCSEQQAPLMLLYLIYIHNTPHCSECNVCHHQKLKLMFVFIYILTFNFFDAANIIGKF